MKRLFGTPKRAVISVMCAAAVVAAVGVVTVRGMLISGDEAKAAALRDAGLSEAETSALRARLEFDDGRFQYEVDFYSNGTEYEYLIQAKDGDIIARDIEGGAGHNNGQGGTDPSAAAKAAQDGGASSAVGAGAAQDAGNPSAAGRADAAQDEGNSSAAGGADAAQDGTDPSAAGAGGAAQDAGNPSAADGNRAQQSQGISADEAKAAALADAGLSEADVTWKKTESDYEHGIQVYEIEFYTSDTEYDYEINASDGTVIKKSIESFQIRPGQTDSSGSNEIGVDRAKEIALNHAGMSESEVRFTKAKQENDDGRLEYEIEFYSGRTEYEYTIDAYSGNIIEYDVDYD